MLSLATKLLMNLQKVWRSSPHNNTETFESEKRNTGFVREVPNIYISPQKDSKLMISWDYYKILVIWRKERQKLMHLSDNTPNKLFKFKMKNWVKMNVDSCSKYNTPIAILI